jgi:hypothetical protein
MAVNKTIPVLQCQIAAVQNFTNISFDAHRPATDRPTKVSEHDTKSTGTSVRDTKPVEPIIF